MPDASAPLFDVSRIALAVLDRQGVITSWTKAAEQLVGYPDEEILNRPAEILLDTESRATVADIVEKSHGQDGWGGLVAVRHRNGSRLKLAVRACSLRDAAGETKWVVLARNEEQTPASELGRTMSESLLTHSPIGVGMLDTDLRYVWANKKLTYGGAVPLERRLGLRPTEVYPTEAVERLEEALRRVLETGVPVLNWDLFGPSPADPCRRHAWWLCAFRLEDSVGQVLGVWFMHMDNTERWRALERLALLSEASAHFGNTLDVVQTSQELADVAVLQFADIVTVDLLEPVLSGEEPPTPLVGDSLVLRRAGQQSAHAGCSETAAEPGSVLRRLPTSLSARCLSDGTPVLESLTTDFSASDWIAEDSDRAVMVRTCGIHGVLVAPIRARGVPLGIATFLRSQCPDPFDGNDVSMAEDLLSRAAVCVDNARRFTQERRAALALQHSLLPRVLATVSTVDVASRYLPANVPHAVGGDWFDVIPLSGTRVALVVGDVVGHGTHAATAMGRLRAAVRTLADLDLPPDELLAHLDDLVVNLLDQDEASGATSGEQQNAAAAVLGATCLYAVYDPVTRRCTLARAGHLPPAIVQTDGVVIYPTLPAGPPLGLGLLPFESAELELPEGALLALFTDGLVGTGDQDIDVGLARLAAALGHTGPELEDICSNVIDTLLTRPQRDDAALLLARTHSIEPSQVASWNLACDPAVVADARSHAAQQLAVWGLEELLFTTELLVSELVTNAIRYGRAPIQLRMIRQNTLICEVADGNSTSPHLRHARTTDEGGRGLFLVAQLCRRWGTRYAAPGKIIWAEQAIPDSTAASGTVHATI
ncbi:SpoIIE family protein phosphatase [Streptomyces solisilvae]|uniref:SpoIIE family protein phosphatase n=1 Tax=Streptomyces malaysiensis TaxID=92644 RepID=UPI0036A711D0